MNNSEKHVEGLLAIGKMTLEFARVNRVTLHEDGVRPESDTDHTVMLALSACALASKLCPTLDLGKVAQYAIIHDLVEVYAGDTNSVNLTQEEKCLKEQREHEALKRLQNEFGSVYPWIVTTISLYEKQEDREAMFVKFLDKCMTKVTFCLNNGATIRNGFQTKENIIQHVTNQRKLFEEKFGAIFPEIFEIFEQLTEGVLGILSKSHAV